MRKFLLFVIMVLPMLAFAASVKTVTLDVQGMTCSMCTVTVRKSLQKVPGVKSAKVDLGKNTATVVYDPAKTDPDALVQATGDAGYRSTVRVEGEQPAAAAVAQ